MRAISGIHSLPCHSWRPGAIPINRLHQSMGAEPSREVRLQDGRGPADSTSWAGRRIPTRTAFAIRPPGLPRCRLPFSNQKIRRAAQHTLKYRKIPDSPWNTAGTSGFVGRTVCAGAITVLKPGGPGSPWLVHHCGIPASRTPFSNWCRMAAARRPVSCWWIICLFR